jgi:leucyl aminopeptidase (aminopeptidase T)
VPALEAPIALAIEKGRIASIDSKNTTAAKAFESLLFRQNDEKTRILGEMGIGFNDKAEICGNMLVDEGAYGCIHFGFGANHTIQGANQVNFHVDCIVKKPTLMLDGTVVIREGEFIL